MWGKEQKMTAYIITELQNAQSHRKGEAIEAPSLSAAKRRATALQMFKGTVMQISAQNGAVLSRKKEGRWIDA